MIASVSDIIKKDLRFDSLSFEEYKCFNSVKVIFFQEAFTNSVAIFKLFCKEILIIELKFLSFNFVCFFIIDNTFSSSVICLISSGFLIKYLSSISLKGFVILILFLIFLISWILVLKAFSVFFIFFILSSISVISFSLNHLSNKKIFLSFISKFRISLLLIHLSSNIFCKLCVTLLFFTIATQSKICLISEEVIFFPFSSSKSVSFSIKSIGLQLSFSKNDFVSIFLPFWYSNHFNNSEISLFSLFIIFFNIIAKGCFSLSNSIIGQLDVLNSIFNISRLIFLLFNSSSNEIILFSLSKVSIFCLSL